MTRPVGAAASVAVAAEAARAILLEGGSAADAVLAGLLVAGAADGSALLAPAAALVAGSAAGARVFDGRAAQPGRGADRPRGLRDDEPVPTGALAAVPRSLAMAMLLHGHRGRLPLHAIVRPAVALAKERGAARRAELVRAFGASGVVALRRPELSRPMLLAGGAVAGGLLTARDLEEAMPADEAALAVELGGDWTAHAIPWPASPPQGQLAERRAIEAGDPPAIEGAPIEAAAEVVVAADAWGLVAALSWQRGAGVPVPELEIELPAVAIPVRRGVPRVAPGTPLPAPTPIAVLAHAGAFHAALGRPGRASLGVAELAMLTNPGELEARLRGLGGLAVTTNGRDIRVLPS